MAITLQVPGLPQAGSTALTRGGSPAADGATVTNLLDDVEVIHEFSLSPSARAAGVAQPQSVVAEDDDILEIDVDGFKLWTSAARYAETVRTFRPDAVQRGAIVVDALPAADATRDDDRLASAVRVLRLTKTRLEEQLRDAGIQQEFTGDFGLKLVERGGSWVLAKAITWLIERQLRPQEGLYSWAHVTRPPAAGEPDPAQARFEGFDTRQPILLFLHGTASSTLGSFGAFTEADAADQWKELTGFFGNHIYALEHRTLSRSPIENAIAAAERLPAGAKLYLVSHSRGGLIGDLLCLPGIDEQLAADFTRHGAFDDADQYDRRKLRQLHGLLSDKQFRVQRFARAACPARGTLLASENLDQFLSVIAYLLGLIPALKISPLYEVVKRVALETVHRRWEPGMLPGLEAMTPESPLVHLLNETTQQPAGSLGVIAGDIQGGNWLKRFGVFISDRMIYDNRDNDLVVNTDSMFLGATRASGRYVFDQGSDVSHFNYFKNQRTRLRVSQWMTARDENALTDFRDLAEARVKPVPLQREPGSRASAARPVCLIVPDTMGSDLHAGSSLVWLDRDALAAGGFGRLRDLAASDVETRSVLGEQYGALRDFLSQTHDVFPFAYDWRQSLEAAAAELAQVLGRVLDETRQPVRIVAHGAGGLVVRQLIAQSDRARPDDPWVRMRALQGSRVVMLGTPHRGTYEAVELLLGTHPVAQQVALLDRRLGPGGVVECFQAFPGILELLPRSGATAFFSQTTWRAFGARRHTSPAPDTGLLQDAQSAGQTLGTASLDFSGVCNVVGLAARTVCGVEPGDREVTLELTAEGDGRVTHASSRLPDANNWYAEASHGELVSDARVFPAILDLLESGETKQLSKTAPRSGRAGERPRRTLPERVLYPTSADLLAGVFGRRPERAYRGAEPKGFRVSVVHGDLTFARFPIIVGHYENDTIIGPERVVDQLFDGALSTRYHLGLYPGPLGTFSIVFREPTPLQRSLQLSAGAIVVGLGRWGELTAAQIANIVRRGALEYVLQIDNHAPGPVSPAAIGSRDVGLSVLLIGATASNVSTQDSVTAILRGIAQANLELDSIERVATRIATIEIVELYVDTAIEAARAAKHLAGVLSDELKIRIEAEPLLRKGRQGRVRFATARNVDAWRRWQVTAERSPNRPPQLPDALRRWLGEAATRANVDPKLLAALAGMALVDPEELPPDRLKFVSLSDRARAEVTLEQHQPALIDRLIQSSIGDTRFKLDAARALFELMVPNDLKDGLGQLSNVVFVVDEHTAALPWELMTDGADQPLWTRVRMVRQLQSATFRPHIRTTTASTAYVVGDPRVSPPFAQLKGARQEAEAVAEKLRSGSFEPTLLPPGATALDVLGGLFARPYRIVHLAGHGHHQPATPTAGAISGMVLDNGTYLTAAEVRKMAQVPELVFLNCCSIGQIGAEPAEPRRDVAYNQLAASISRELIEMGVRAVVAAGWAVRDDAALFFARAFYDDMLRGEPFGRALGTARRSTWRQFPDVNTWGAYQAYGDPDFRLLTPPRDNAVTEHVAPEELLQQIDRIWQHARRIDHELELAEADRDRSRLEGARQDQVKELRALIEEVPDDWRRRSDIRVAIGEAFGELAEYKEAIDQLEAALDTGEPNSKTTIKAAEQLLNFHTRSAADTGDEKALRTTIRRLEALQEVGRTSERWSLLGGAYKRLATVLEDPAAVRPAIESAATMYNKAYEHDANRGTFDHYPVVNWLTLRVVLDDKPTDLEARLDAAERNAEDRFVRDRSAPDAAFGVITRADIAVVRALAQGTFATEGEDRTRLVERIVALYNEAFLRAQATSRQRQSATGQLRALETFLTKLDMASSDAEGASSEATRLTAEALRLIREQL